MAPAFRHPCRGPLRPRQRARPGLPGRWRRRRAGRTASRASTSPSPTASIAAHRAAPARRPAAVDLDGGLVCPAFVDIHTHLDKGHIWPRRPQSRRHLHRRARRRRRRPRRATGRPTTSRARMDFSLRCAYAHGTAAIRTHLDSIAAAARDLLGGVRRDARELARPDRAAGRRPVLGIEHVADRAHVLDGLRRACREPWRRAGRRHLHGARARPGRSTRCSASPREHGLDLDLHADETGDPERTLAAATSPRRCSRPASPASPRRPLLLAGACRTTATRSAPSRRSPRPASPSCRCRCATCTCRTASPAARRAARGVTLLHELKARRRAGRRRLRQHARSVLRLWRPRRARGAARGRAHPAFRPSAGRAGLGPRPSTRDAGGDLPASTTRPRSRSARRPISCCSAPAPGPSCCRGRSPTASCCATARPIDTTLPDYRELDDLMEA